MNRDPLGIGPMLYGLRPASTWEQLSASVFTVGPLDEMEWALAHEGCSLTTFCKNPLHPGPCKGWRKKLGMEAPGVAKALDKIHKEGVATRRAKRLEAKSTAEKGLGARQLSSPLHAKKATAKHANIILGNDETKASGKASKVILNKTEIKKYSKIKAAQVQGVLTKHGMAEDTGLEDRLAEAFAEDNKTGKDERYRSVLATSAASLSAKLAADHCHKGNHKECDDQVLGQLRDHLATAAEHALLTGDNGQLDADLAAWDAGKLDVGPPPEPDKTPAVNALHEALQKVKAKKQGEADAAEAAKKAAAAPEPKPKKKAKAAPAPLEGNAAAADKGMKYGLGLMAFLKGNKTLGTKAYQANFAEKIKKELDGDGPNVTQKGADDLALGVVLKPGKAKLSQPYVAVGSTATKKALILEVSKEIEQGLKGEDGPTPHLDAFKHAIQAQNDKDWDEAKKAEKTIADLAAKAMGVPEPTHAPTLAEELGVSTPKPWTAQEEYLTHAKKVAAGDYDGNQPQQVGLIGLISKEQFDGDLNLGEQEALKEKLQQIHATAPQILKDKAAATYLKLTGEPIDAGEPDVLQQLLDDVPMATGGGPSSKYLGKGVSVTALKEAFGPDGNPDHEEAVHLVNGMNHLQWDQLSVNEKAIAAGNVADASLNDEPGADAAIVKLQKLGQHVPNHGAPGSAPAPGPAVTAPPLSAETKVAADLARGNKSMTAKGKLTAYEKVTGSEFEKLDADTQKLVLADLLAIKDKFVDPKKKKLAQEHYDYLSGHMGGGAGAGGGGNPGVAAGAPSMDAAIKDLPSVSLNTAAPGDKPSDAAIIKAFQGMVDAIGQDKAADALAPTWAEDAMKKLNAMHPIHPDVLAGAQSALAADIAKKLKGTGEPTPVYDAYVNAITLGSFYDAESFLDVAHGFAGPSTVGGKPSAASQVAVSNDVAALWQSAAPGHVAAPSAAEVAPEVTAASMGGFNTPEYATFAKDQGSKMASNVAVGALMDANLAGVDNTDLVLSPAFAKVSKAMSDELAQAIKDGAVEIPKGGYTEQFKAAVKDTDKAANDLASHNGWAPDSPTIVEYKKTVVQAKLDALAEQVGGAPVPAHAPAAHAGAGGGPNLATPASAPPVIGGDIDGIPFEKQQEILGDLKGMPTGKYLSDPKETTYGNLLALASVHGTAGKPLSVMQVLKSVDNAFADQLGVANGNKWENEFVDWLKTPAGKAFADANQTPDANLVKKLSGVYDGPVMDTADLGKKLGVVHPGPGQFDAAKSSDDFKAITNSSAAKLREQMLSASGGKYTPAELHGIHTYTGSSYMAMNSWLRGDSGSITESQKKAIKEAQSAMRPVPHDILVHRGTGFSQLPEGFQSASGAKKLVGQTFVDEAFLSTSVGGNPAFGGNMLLEIEVPKGSYGAYVDGKQDGQSVSANPGESEFLLAGGGHYHVVSVKQVGGKTVMRLRVVNAV